MAFWPPVCSTILLDVFCEGSIVRQTTTWKSTPTRCAASQKSLNQQISKLLLLLNSHPIQRSSSSAVKTSYGSLHTSPRPSQHSRQPLRVTIRSNLWHSTFSLHGSLVTFYLLSGLTSTTMDLVVVQPTWLRNFTTASTPGLGRHIHLWERFLTGCKNANSKLSPDMRLAAGRPKKQRVSSYVKNDSDIASTKLRYTVLT